jgi:hypothetical protein
MAAKRRLDEQPSFVIRPAKNGQSWSVLLVAKGRHAVAVYEFASEKAAQNWIDYESKLWLRKRKAA